ncbi:hypothetical protein [Streptomyces sp. NPDC006307]|uniref:hypothetical protein n=1 Tax=Streptomyces sp. NPDC006307 TaxID=3156748 RepID=UPI0033BA79C6
MSLITRDEATGLRRGFIRYPDGSPPELDGCRWCGTPHETHGLRWSDAASWHQWARPTHAQVEARARAHIVHGIPRPALPASAAPSLLEAAIGAFQTANDHIRDGCTTCAPASRLPDMCPEGQRLALAAVHALATDPTD